jgi:hypothetical protein
MKLLVKIMVIFATLYAVAAMMRRVCLQWPFAFLATALLGLLGTAGDRIFMPKMNRITAALLDALMIAGTLFGTNALGDLIAPRRRSKDRTRLSLPYVGVVSGLLGGFESLYHEWVHHREPYQKAAEGGNLL